MSEASQENRAAEGFLHSLGIRFKRVSGSNIAAYCPFHGDEATPSLSIRADSGQFFCFSPACDARGGSFFALARKAGLSWQDALARVRDFSLAEASPQDTRKKERVVEPVRVGRFTVDWRNPPESAKKAYRWLVEERGITPEVLNDVQIGFDDETGEVVFLQFATIDGRVACVGLSRRVPGKQKMIKHFPVGKFLWPLLPEPTTDIVLVEGEFDCLKGRVAKITTLGTHGAGLSNQQVELLRGHKGAITVFQDNDGAGVAATSKMLAALGPHRCRVVVEFFGCKDPGEMTPAQIRQAVEQATPGQEYLLNWSRYRLSLVKSGNHRNQVDSLGEEA